MPTDPQDPARRAVLTTLASLSAAACTQTVHPTQPLTAGPRAPLDAMLEPLRARHGLPALAALVHDGATVLARGAVGVRKRGDPTPVSVHDRWHLGSDTKAMTATLVARLVERGVVRWETTLAEALPLLADRMQPAYRGVTLETLLHHRAGVVGDLLAHPLIWLALRAASGSMTDTRRAFAASVLALEPEVPAGTFRYANAGYMLVGAALEAVTGRAWEDLLRAEVFAPLGITTGGFGPPATDGTVDAPWGHQAVRSGLEPVAPGPLGDNPPALGPAGTVHCSLDDWARFTTAHLRGARGEGDGYLTAASWTRLHTPPQPGGYALGWLVPTRPWAGGTALTHQGSNTLFLATVWIAPARDRAVLVVTNAGHPAASQATEDALGALIGAWVRA